ncbi:hypothetical protein [Ottowia sp. VDI28]|uniref:hypothetical protein n=1 Tax=Ottowia sp. VDI28 TaxID=3133968 RepID=UPI003C3017E1
MTQTIEDQIAELAMKREVNKQLLFEKVALRLRRKELFFVHGEPTSLQDRIALDSEIATLEADRQRSKVQMLQLKKQAREADRQREQNAAA